MNKPITLRASEHGAVDAPVSPILHAPDPFIDLPENLKAEMRSVLGPLANANCPLEYDPVIPMTVGTALEGRLFRVCVVSQGGIPNRVAILGPGMIEWSKDDFLALIPEGPDVAPLQPMTSTARTIARPQSEILEDVLRELKAIRSALGA